jgi:hypothetical protein
MDVTENFTCIKCDKEFTVTASLGFNVDVEEETTVEQLSLF